MGGHQAFNLCPNTASAAFLKDTCGVYYDSSVTNSDTYCSAVYGAVFICCGNMRQSNNPMSMFCVNPGTHVFQDDGSAVGTTPATPAPATPAPATPAPATPAVSPATPAP